MAVFNIGCMSVWSVICNYSIKQTVDIKYACRHWGFVYMETFLSENAKFPLGMHVSFTRQQWKRVQKCFQFENTIQSGIFWKRKNQYAEECHVNTENVLYQAMVEKKLVLVVVLLCCLIALQQVIQHQVTIIALQSCFSASVYIYIYSRLYTYHTL